MNGKSKIMAAIDEATEICEGAIIRLEACETILRKVFPSGFRYDVEDGWNGSGEDFTDDEKSLIDGLVRR